MKEPKFNSTVARAIAYMTALGRTDDEIADILDLGGSTLQYWRSKMPDFAAMVAEQKDIADRMVEISLYQRATGYSYTETKHATHEGVFTDEREVTRYVPPDINAITFWLRNRKPDMWREKPNDKPPEDRPLEELSDAELAALAGGNGQ